MDLAVVTNTLSSKLEAFVDVVAWERNPSLLYLDLDAGLMLVVGQPVIVALVSRCLHSFPLLKTRQKVS